MTKSNNIDKMTQMLFVLLGIVSSMKCAPCFSQRCLKYCRLISDEEYERIMKEHEGVRVHIIDEKANRAPPCYPSRCWVSRSQPHLKRCTEDCSHRPTKITYPE